MQSETNPRSLTHIKRLIWLYFFLLIFEGTFRKWVLPQFSDVLLVVRDPVVLAIYFFAIKARVFPRNNYVLALGIIGVLSWLVSLRCLEPYLPLKPLILVTGFGFRSNFLHLPLIFIIGSVFDQEDVIKLGKWVLIGLIPMCVLLAVQFNAAPDCFYQPHRGPRRNASRSRQVAEKSGRPEPSRLSPESFFMPRSPPPFCFMAL